MQHQVSPVDMEELMAAPYLYINKSQFNTLNRESEPSCVQTAGTEAQPCPSSSSSSASFSCQFSLTIVTLYHKSKVELGLLIANGTLVVDVGACCC
jgi:hypothetical protein